MENFIYIKENFLSSDRCNAIIAKMEENPQSTNIIKYNYTDEIGQQLIHLLTPEIKNYIQTMYCPVTKYSSDKEVIAEYYIIKKIPQNTKHHTYVNTTPTTGNGFVSFVIYLNNVENGNDTILEHNTIEPTIGKLVLFPCDWMFPLLQESSVNCNKYVFVGNILFAD
jgi:hypothetical protein